MTGITYQNSNNTKEKRPKLVILKGCSGSGKSFLAKQLQRQNPSFVILSTDNYWIRPDGVYDFNFRLLSQAHQWNYQCFLDCINLGSDVIIDNTNVTFKEVRPYYEAASLSNYDYQIELVEPDTTWKFDVEQLFLRNSHAVPKETIQRMLEKWETTEEILAKLGERKEAA